MSTHWFDRLASRHTRREALKAALVGTAALGLPALQAPPAAADDPKACRTGCAWFAHQSYNSAINSCRVPSVTAVAGGFARFLFLSTFSPVYGIYRAGRYEFRQQDACWEQAAMQQKADYFDCLKPNCNNFDPTQKGGPCDTCTATCCVDPTVISGYSCCALGCACGGTDAGACHGSVTPC